MTAPVRVGAEGFASLGEMRCSTRKGVRLLSHQGVQKLKCWACYGSLAYLAGYCPVCNDTGFIEVNSQEPAPGPKSNSDSGFAAEREEMVVASNPGFFL
jgi:hypothetical protein